MRFVELEMAGSWAAQTSGTVSRLGGDEVVQVLRGVALRSDVGGRGASGKEFHEPGF